VTTTRTPEQRAEAKRDAQARYREAHPGAAAARSATWYAANREKIRAKEQAERDAAAAEGRTSHGTRRQSKDWQRVILPAAAAIVRSYSTCVTLRQLFYQLVARRFIPNTKDAYQGLSHASAEARRAGDFPDLIEGGRTIHQPTTFDGPDEARTWLRDTQYQRDRTEGQATQIILAVEKAGIVEQLLSWYEDLGVPIVGLGGYSSATLEAKLNDLAGGSFNWWAETTYRIGPDGKPHRLPRKNTVLIYAGDFDPSGEDIVRNLADHIPSIYIEQVALTADQVAEYGLPENPGKESDSRAAGFVERHGRLVQVELDALDPNTLHQLYQDAIAQYWDDDAYAAALAQEAKDRAKL